MKAILRLPTLEQYAYIECEFEGTEEEIVDEYKKLKMLVTGSVGLDTKDFNRVLDKYIWGDETMLADEYAVMNLEQQNIVQPIKRTRARNKTKNQNTMQYAKN